MRGMILSLEEVKLYLKVDGDEEDTLITHFILSAEEMCECVLRCPLNEFLSVPESIKQAVLFGVGNMYEQRENLNADDVFRTMRSLLICYRKDSW